MQATENESPVAPDDILRSYEEKRLVCARNRTLFTALFPIIQSLRQTGNLIFPETDSFRHFIERIQITDSPVSLHNVTFTQLYY